MRGARRPVTDMSHNGLSTSHTDPGMGTHSPPRSSEFSAILAWHFHTSCMPHQSPAMLVLCRRLERFENGNTLMALWDDTSNNISIDWRPMPMRELISTEEMEQIASDHCKHVSTIAQR